MYYMLFKNDKYYGSGDREYMTELFQDWVEVCDMYGEDSCTFEVRRVTNPQFAETLEKRGLINKKRYEDG